MTPATANEESTRGRTSPTGSTQRDITPGSLLHVCDIASGGMGHVALVAKQDRGFRRLYAVKRLHPHFREDSEMLAMFMDEARIAGLLHHPNVVGVVDVGEDESGPYLIMDFVDGLGIDQLMTEVKKRDLTLPIQVALRIGIDIANGLHAAHELTSHDGVALGLVHRDLSPHNVLIGYDGVARITDFGVAKAVGREARTTTGLLKGKVAYMSPEHLAFEVLDRRTDLFALGVVLFEMLGATRLYKMDDPRKTVRRILHEPPPDIAEVRPDAPPALVELMFSLLSKEREHRPHDAKEVAETLQDIVAALVAEEGLVPVSSFTDPVTKEYRKSRHQAVSAAIVEAETRLLPAAHTDTVPDFAAARQARRRGLLRASALVTIASVTGFGVAMVSMQPDQNDAPVPEERAAVVVDAPAPRPAPAIEEPLEETTLDDPPDLVFLPDEAQARGNRPRANRRPVPVSAPAEVVPDAPDEMTESTWESW